MSEGEEKIYEKAEGTCVSGIGRGAHRYSGIDTLKGEASTGSNERRGAGDRLSPIRVERI